MNAGANGVLVISCINFTVSLGPSKLLHFSLYAYIIHTIMVYELFFYFLFSYT